MIRLRRRPLRHSDQAELQVWQRRLDGVLPFDQRIGTTWTAFSRTELRGRVNRWVRYQSLRRCIYRERSECETIDHYYPKMQFPDRAFDWTNFGGSCWNCNRYKGQPPLFQNGQPKIINPLNEDPAELLYFDPNTRFISPAPHLDEGSDAFIRADYTITMLKLNERGLPKERRIVAADLRRALRLYFETGGHPAVEEAILALLREQSALRAVLRGVMANPALRDKLLVGYRLERSKRVRRFLQAIAWL